MKGKSRQLGNHPPIVLKVKDEEEAATLANALQAARQESFGRGRSAIDRWAQQIHRLLPAAIEAPQNVFSLEGHSHVPAVEATTIQSIFDHWRDVMAKPRARLDDKRRNLIRRRLRESFSEAELRAAIDGCRASPWHQGENESGTRYVELSLIFRNAENIERFCELAETPPRPRSTASSVQATKDARVAWRNVLAHVRAGRHRQGETLGEPIAAAVNKIGGYSAVGMATERQLFDLERRFVESFIEVVAAIKDKTQLQPSRRHSGRQS